MSKPITSMKEAVDLKLRPIIAARVSSSGQRKGLPAQAKALREFAKDAGFKKEPVEFQIRQTGRAGELKSIEEIRKLVEANPRERYIAVFRDLERFARNTENAFAIRRQLSELGVPVIFQSIPLLHGNKPMGDRAADIVFGSLAVVADFAKNFENIAREIGQASAAEAGVIAGEPRDFFLKQYKAKGKSVHRRLAELLPALENKDVSGRELTKLLKIGDSTRRKIQAELLALNEEKREEFLQVIDAILEAEKTIGKPRNVAAPKRTRRLRALHRVTVAYLQFPEKFPNPIEGNPNIAPLTGFVGDGSIADALASPEKYQPPRK